MRNVIGQRAAEKKKKKTNNKREKKKDRGKVATGAEEAERPKTREVGMWRTA